MDFYNLYVKGNRGGDTYYGSQGMTHSKKKHHEILVKPLYFIALVLTSLCKYLIMQTWSKVVDHEYG